MKIKRKLKTSVILSFVTTLLILSIIDFSFVLPTNSKFKKAGGKGTDGVVALEYKVGFYQLYRTGNIYVDDKIPNLKADQATKTFTLKFEFPRQLLNVTSDVSPENLDVYSFNVSLGQGQGCTITNISSANALSSTTNSITFDHKNETDEKIAVELKCNDTVKPENGVIEFSIGVREKVGNEIDFAYTDYDFKITEEYYDDIMGIVKWSNPLTVKYGNGQECTSTLEVAQKFKEWMEYYLKDSPHADTVKNYLHMGEGDDSYQNYIISGATNWDKEILGLKKEAVVTGGSKNRVTTYTYKIEENLIGYARTAEEPNKKINMYFTATTAEEVEKAFDYYLTEAKFTTEEIAEIKEYIDVRGGIAKIVLDGKVILGLRYVKSDNRLVLDTRLLEYAKSMGKYGDVAFIEHKTDAGMLSSFWTIVDGLDIVSDKLKDRTTGNDSALYRQIGVANIIKNNTDDYLNNAKSFVDYYFSWDEVNNYFIVTKIFSDVTLNNDNKNNMYQFTKLELPSEMDISFENDPTNPDKLTIELYIYNSYVNDSGTTVTVSESQARMDAENVAITLRKYFSDIGTLNSTTGEVEGIWTTSTTYEVPTFVANSDGWVATFVVSKDYQSLITASNDTPTIDGPSADESNASNQANAEQSEASVIAQESLESVKSTTSVVAAPNIIDDSVQKEANNGTTDENLNDSLESNDEEKNSLSLISSIMRFVKK